MWRICISDLWSVSSEFSGTFYLLNFRFDLGNYLIFSFELLDHLIEWPELLLRIILDSHKDIIPLALIVLKLVSQVLDLIFVFNLHTLKTLEHLFNHAHNHFVVLALIATTTLVTASNVRSEHLDLHSQHINFILHILCVLPFVVWAFVILHIPANVHVIKLFNRFCKLGVDFD